MSSKDGRNVKTRGFTRNGKRQYTKSKSAKGRPGNIWNKS